VLKVYIFRLAFIFLIATSLIHQVYAGQKTVPASRQQMTLSFAPVVSKSAPSVVNIYTRTTVRTRSRSPLLDDPFFRRFFGEQFGLDSAPMRKRTQNSLGSGVIIGSNGIIVTNRHVIEGADEIRVVLHDRREFDAKVKATDEKTDLAILEIDVKDSLPVLQLADSDRLEVGDVVLAIGNPFGVGQTVTSGIVSALARSEVGLSKLGSFIQTDAAINPGNSGGALVGLDGRLVGINTAIFSKSGGSMGIGFAIPSNLVRAVVRGVMETGKFIRPWLGAAGQSVTQDIANSLGMERPAGVLVSALHEDGAAAHAGMRVGDVILSIGGHEIYDPSALAHRVATLPVGDRVTLDIWRNREPVSLDVGLTAAPEKPARDTSVLDGEQPLTGATIANMSPALAEELSVDAFASGVYVLNIKRGSPADRLGFQVGDYIRAINGEKADSVRNLKKVLALTVNRWRVSVMRDGHTRDMVINR